MSNSRPGLAGVTTTIMSDAVIRMVLQPLPQGHRAWFAAEDRGSDATATQLR
jgi:hypothetical protein